MKTENRKSIAGYTFEDHKAMIKGLIAGNLILALIFLLGDWSNLWRDARTQICLVSAIIFLLINVYYNWKSPKFNGILMLVYLSIFAFEFFNLGIPKSPIEYKEYISKGAMLQMFLGFLPCLYIGLRLGLVFPLIQIIFSSQKLEKFSR